MTRLNQIIALVKGVKPDAQRKFTDLHHVAQQTPLFAGLTRTYQKKDDEGDDLPSESTQVRLRADAVLADVSEALTRLFDVVATQDLTNTAAKADVVVDGRTLLHDVPATTLLFLEKQLTDLHTFVAKLPTLDLSEQWVWNEAANCWTSVPAKTTRTKKVPRNHVKAEATQHHPAQVEVFTEDVVVGYWTTTKLSGALPARRVAELVARVTTLREAVKHAREEANMTEVRDARIGKAVFEYLFA